MAIPGVNSAILLTDTMGETSVWKTVSVLRTLVQTPGIKSVFLQVGDMSRHLAGQHVVVRLTAPDGYTAMRSYSIASAPNDDGVIELAIERLADGEVSPYFHDVVEAGDEIEIRGPLGGYFVWHPAQEGPILLIGGGSGVVPLVSMIRQRLHLPEGASVSLLLSARAPTDALYYDELLSASEHDAIDFTATFTRLPSSRQADFNRRVDTVMVSTIIDRMQHPPRLTYICGSNGFVNTATDAAIAAGIPAETIRTERYGG